MSVAIRFGLVIAFVFAASMASAQQPRTKEAPRLTRSVLPPVAGISMSEPERTAANKRRLSRSGQPIVCAPKSVEGYWSFNGQLLTIPENPTNATLEVSFSCQSLGLSTVPFPISLNAGGLTGYSQIPNSQCRNVTVAADFVGDCHHVEGTVSLADGSGQPGRLVGEWLGPLGSPPVCAQAGNVWINAQVGCLPGLDIDRTSKEPLTCPVSPEVGKPIRVLTGAQREPVPTGLMIGREELVITYDSVRLMSRLAGSATPSHLESPSFGVGWFGSFHRRAVAQGDRGLIQVSRGDGRIVTTSTNGIAFDSDTLDTVLERGGGGGYYYLDAMRRTVESYSGARFAKLSRLDWLDGQRLQFVYSTIDTPVSVAPAPDYLIAVQDSFGREIRFGYLLPAGGVAEYDAKVGSITDTSGRSVFLTYDTKGNLETITWADGQTRRFIYDDPRHVWALTGMNDERAIRHFSIGYDSAGRATSSQLAGGVDAYSIDYGSAPPQVASVSSEFDPNYGVASRIAEWRAASPAIVTLPDGTSTTMASSLVAGLPRIGSRSQVGGSGCGASSSNVSYNSYGDAISIDDFNGIRSCFAYEALTHRELFRVDGLQTTALCSALTLPNSALPSGARKTSTSWHSKWRLKAVVAEPRRLTTYVYNGEPDPFGGGIASCAPAGAQLAFGGPIAVLCKKIEQATMDENGSKGFGASAEPGTAPRIQTWTYNEEGQVLTYDGPRTDVADITYYTYYTDTVFNSALPDAVGHTKGDLASVLGPDFLETFFTKYNRAGKLVESIDPNGVTSIKVYDARQRLREATTSGLTTSYEYWPTGLLRRITMADGTWVDHEYDDAHRLRVIRDDRGNSISYTLDNRGRRTAEEVRDPGNQLRRTLSRSIDTLGRVQQVTGRE